MLANKKTARATGILYLVIFFANVFAFFFVTERLILPGDAAGTASNILANEGLYRGAIVSYLLVFLSDIAVAILLYQLLRPVNQTIAAIATATRLMQTAVHGVNLINLVFPLLLLTGGSALSDFSATQLNAGALLFLDAHHYGVLISEAFFAVSTLLLAYLVYRSELFPALLGILLAIASLGYFLDSFVFFLLPQYEAVLVSVMQPMAVVGELSFTIYLLVKGVRLARRPTPAAVATA